MSSGGKKLDAGDFPSDTGVHDRANQRRKARKWRNPTGTWKVNEIKALIGGRAGILEIRGAIDLALHALGGQACLPYLI